MAHTASRPSPSRIMMQAFQCELGLLDVCVLYDAGKCPPAWCTTLAGPFDNLKASRWAMMRILSALSCVRVTLIHWLLHTETSIFTLANTVDCSELHLMATSPHQAARNNLTRRRPAKHRANMQLQHALQEPARHSDPCRVPQQTKQITQHEKTKNSYVRMKMNFHMTSGQCRTPRFMHRASQSLATQQIPTVH